jgi:GDP-L-fucose synthase
MTILITGSTGMLGQALKRLSPPDIDIHYLTKSECDCRDSQAVERLFQNKSYKAVIHCAAKVGGIQANIDDPIHFLADNVTISTNLIMCAYRYKIPKFINIGSSCMYPRNHNDLLRESDILTAPLEPTNEAYAIAKIAAARLCRYIAQEGGLAYKTFIPCNMYGVGDKFDEREGHLIAAAIVKIDKAIKDSQGNVEIWGDGQARREFIYVDDVANFIWQSLSNLEKLPQDMNLGCDVDKTILEFYQMIADCMGYRGTFIFKNSAPVGMSHKLMDSTLSKSYGWRVQTTLTDGIKRAVDSYRTRAGLLQGN